MSDLDNNRRLDPRDRDGISTGTIAAIIAVVVIIGALLLWHPWNANNGSASNSSGTTTGQTSTGTGGSAPGKK
jgi:tetrahydromethanopterin S-methyltransferase subunit C